MSETISATDENLVLLEGLEVFSKHAHSLITKTRRNVYILSNSLDHQLFNNDAIESALSLLVREDRNAEVRILVKNTRPLIDHNHKLLQLARRLPSKIKLRKLLVEPENDERAYLIGDRNLLLYRHDELEYAGFANYQAGPEVLKIMEEFNYLWQRQSAEDIELRSLTL